ncbi:MAG: CGNR zinc finger domain-containing protein [Actinomycetia bacterium]|nr:CGNR zinc finger domain-containing protein [Actinomycetes bacterium]
MDFSHYSDVPVQIAVDLVNTLDAVSGEEKLASPHDVTEFIRSRDTDWCKPGWSATPSDLDDVIALRFRLRMIFDAADESAAADTINCVLSEAGAVPRLSLHGEGPHLHFESDDDRPARWLGAVTAMGLTVALIEGGFERFGTCMSSSCDDVFVDGSRNRSRRHCSDTCTSRENVAAHRARQRNAAASSDAK